MDSISLTCKSLGSLIHSNAIKLWNFLQIISQNGNECIFPLFTSPLKMGKTWSAVASYSSTTIKEMDEQTDVYLLFSEFVQKIKKVSVPHAVRIFSTHRLFSILPVLFFLLSLAIMYYYYYYYHCDGMISNVCTSERNKNKYENGRGQNLTRCDDDSQTMFCGRFLLQYPRRQLFTTTRCVEQFLLLLRAY